MPGRCSGCSSWIRRSGTTPDRRDGPGWPPTCARWTSRWTAGCASGSAPRRRSCRRVLGEVDADQLHVARDFTPYGHKRDQRRGRGASRRSGRGSRPARRTPWRRGRSGTGRAIPTRCSRRTAGRGVRTDGTTRSARRGRSSWVSAEDDKRVQKMLDKALRDAPDGMPKPGEDAARQRFEQVPRARPRRVRRPARRPRRRPHVADVAVPQARGDASAPAPRAHGRLTRQGPAHLRDRARLARLLRRRAPPQPEVGVGGPAARSRA